jgi:hypothetical protein
MYDNWRRVGREKEEVLNCFALLSVFEPISFENPFHQFMKEL